MHWRGSDTLSYKNNINSSLPSLSKIKSLPKFLKFWKSGPAVSYQRFRIKNKNSVNSHIQFFKYFFINHIFSITVNCWYFFVAENWLTAFAFRKMRSFQERKAEKIIDTKCSKYIRLTVFRSSQNSPVKFIRVGWCLSLLVSLVRSNCFRPSTLFNRVQFPAFTLFYLP